MAERSRNKRERSLAQRAPRSTRAKPPMVVPAARYASVPGDCDAEGDSSDERNGSMTLAEAKERIIELKADLDAAKITIRALLDKAEKRIPRSSAEVTQESEVAVPGEDGLTPGANEPEKPLESGEQQQESETLDKIVRRQTRALAESEAQLRRKNAELKRLNEMKAEFISIAAHELRTPLTSIVGYLDLLAEGRFGDPPSAMDRPLASLHRNAHKLRRLVDEMLDVSRIEQGQIRLFRLPCDLGTIIKYAVAELASLAKSENLSLKIELNEPPLIDADAEKMRQVVGKLVASAMRYTPEGGTITVAADAAPQERYAGAWTRLRVRHTGASIPRHLHTQIFEPFFDVESARHHTSSGPDSAGLGLYIARGLIDLHGGLILIESEEDAFTEFTVLLPRSPATAE